jgi:hypothetical protein
MHMPNVSELVRDTFFGENDVLLTTEILVRSLSDYTDDPLTAFGNLAIRNAITCTLTQDGLSPFSSDLRVLIPFGAMTAAQLHVLRDITSAISDLEVMYYKHPNGSCSVSCVRDAGKVFANVSLLLFALNALILRAVEGQAVDAQTVINVTQQRISATINVHRSQILEADARTRKFIADHKLVAPSL